METLEHTEEKDGFTIKLYRLDEDDSPKGHFASGDDKADQAIIDSINSGILDWFCAKVTASLGDIELAADHLGGCCYDSIDRFRKDNDYYADMVNNVITEAKKRLDNICQPYKKYPDIHALATEQRKIAIIWGVDDVTGMREDLNEDQAWEILQACERRHDAEIGFNWLLIETVAEELFPKKED